MMSAVLEFLPEAQCDAEEAIRFYERRFRVWVRDFERRSRVSVQPSFANHCSGVSVPAAIGASTFPDFPTTSHTSSAASALLSPLWAMRPAIQTTGSGANSKSDRNG